MAPTLSPRALLTYASNLISQVPLLGGLSNSIPDSLPSIFEPAGSTTPHETYQDQQSTFDGMTPYDPLTGTPSCPLDGPISCQNKTVADSCCFIHPGGRLLLTQFWDEEIHAGGTDEDWTLHGLW